MSTCLGLYIEDNIIKYAKVSKDNDNVKIDSFGIKFYDKISDAISQVIEETYSYKTPISINVSNETYNYFYLFNLLSKKDIQNVINTEFESICYDNGINKDAYETRYVLVNDLTNKEKIKAIHVSANKADLAKKTQQLDGYKISSASPIGTSIGNLLDFKKKENCIIVNIEDKTSITTIIDKKIVEVQTLDEGAGKILSNINQKENSYSKSYEVCKNTTIYTSEGKDLQEEEDEYLEDIMPTLYKIVGTVRKITNENLDKIDKVYITGTAAVVNNIDIYFQEYLKDIKCEILKPYFINNKKTKINIRDYIEVNSAIALGLQGLGEGLKGLNFKKETLADKLPDWLTMEIGGETGNLKNKKKKFSLGLELSGKLTPTEQTLMRIVSGLIILIITYSGIMIFVNNSMNSKKEEIAKATTEANSQIALINNDNTRLKTSTNKYISMTEKLTDLNAKVEDKHKRKNAIPALLNRIMFSIPKGVQITSIENTTGNKIIINAQANTYEQLGYFKVSIRNDGILTNVVSDNAQKQTQEGVVKTSIEGTLPIE